VLALVPASASVWQAPQAVEVPLPSVKSVLPSGVPPPPPAGAGGAVSFCMKASYWAVVTTCAVWRMSECPRPQSSAQTTG
jgi:hypothetical protein